jgi:cell division protein FtsB
MQKDAALRKRTQIAKANRTMFLWVSIVSVILGVALVASIFLVQKIVFNEKVLAEKAKTVSTLEKNNVNIKKLEENIRALDTNADLSKVKVNSDDQAIQVILDALPSEANSPALGASIQNKLLDGIPGLTIVSLQVDPVLGVETLDPSTQTTTVVAPLGQSAITFRFAVSGSETALKTALTNLERSIRTINISSLRIESQGTSQLLTVQASAFYEPARVVELKEKVVK